MSIVCSKKKVQVVQGVLTAFLCCLCLLQKKASLLFHPSIGLATGGRDQGEQRCNPAGFPGASALRGATARRLSGAGA